MFNYIYILQKSSSNYQNYRQDSNLSKFSEAIIKKAFKHLSIM